MGGLTQLPDWYLMRASGVVALILFSAVLALGIATANRWRPGRLPRFVILGLHRNLSLLAVVFLGVHVVTAVLDSYSHMRLIQVLVPLPTGSYSLWLGLGALSLDLTLAVVVTSLLRHRLSQRLWKGVHGLAYASWPLAFAHSIGIGTDAGSEWLLDVALACLATVVAAVVWRILGNSHPQPKYLGAPLEPIRSRAGS
jgi:methionine sulfoxide reductase heme-binding subunit